MHAVRELHVPALLAFSAGGLIRANSAIVVLARLANGGGVRVEARIALRLAHGVLQVEGQVERALGDGFGALRAGGGRAGLAAGPVDAAGPAAGGLSCGVGVLVVERGALVDAGHDGGPGLVLIGVLVEAGVALVAGARGRAALAAGDAGGADEVAVGVLGLVGAGAAGADAGRAVLQVVATLALDARGRVNFFVKGRKLPQDKQFDRQGEHEEPLLKNPVSQFTTQKVALLLTWSRYLSEHCRQMGPWHWMQPLVWQGTQIELLL